jgi:hypothetical protein
MGSIANTRTRSERLRKPSVDLGSDLSNERLGWSDIHKDAVIRVSKNLLHGIVGDKGLACTSRSCGLL